MDKETLQEYTGYILNIQRINKLDQEIAMAVAPSESYIKEEKLLLSFKGKTILVSKYSVYMYHSFLNDQSVNSIDKFMVNRLEQSTKDLVSFDWNLTLSYALKRIKTMLYKIEQFENEMRAINKLISK